MGPVVKVIIATPLGIISDFWKIGEELPVLSVDLLFKYPSWKYPGEYSERK